MFSVVKDNLKQPLLGGRGGRQCAHCISIMNTFGITIGRSRLSSPIPFIRLCLVDIAGIFGFVLDFVAASTIVLNGRQEPRKDPSVVVGIEKATVRIDAIQRNDIVLRNCPPVSVSNGINCFPSLDTLEDAFDARAISVDGILNAVDCRDYRRDGSPGGGSDRAQCRPGYRKSRPPDPV